MWQTIRLADFGSVITGKTPSSKNPQHFGKAYPFITPTDIGANRIVATERRISEEGASKFKCQMLPRNSVCFVCIGATIGKICLTSEPSLTNQQINSIIVDETRHDPFFVYYLLSTYTEKVKSLAGGAATPIVNKTAFQDIQAFVPPRPVQRKIAAILSAYDDLIENNLRRIKILEEMAQAIYREWFVHFRFPGHENARFVDSPLGKIPEGWELKKASEAMWINPREKVVKDKEKPYVVMEGLSCDCMLVTVKELRTGSGGSKYRNGDTLFARITPCLENGKTGFVQFLPSDSEIGIGSTEFIVLRSKELCPEYVYLLARTGDFRGNAVKSMTGASGRQRVQVECFNKHFLARPDDAILRSFSETVRPMFRRIQMLSIENQNLRRTRDLLLPKLISGELDVSELDIQVGENEQ